MKLGLCFTSRFLTQRCEGDGARDFLADFLAVIDHWRTQHALSQRVPRGDSWGFCGPERPRAHAKPENGEMSDIKPVQMRNRKY